MRPPSSPPSSVRTFQCSANEAAPPVMAQSVQPIPAVESRKAISASSRTGTSMPRQQQPGSRSTFDWPRLPSAQTHCPVRLVKLQFHGHEFEALQAQLQSWNSDVDEPRSKARHRFSDVLRRVPYIAVSYACGSGHYDKHILLNSRDFYIRQNLYDFLEVYAGSPDHHQKLWVDALCINQDDEAERSQQVQLMSEIYTRAFKVIAWLGPAADDSDWCFERLNFISGKNDIFSDSIDYERSRYLDAAGVRLCAGVTAILKRSMFSRIWCVQELVLPPTVVLMCGTRTVNWEKFRMVADMFTFDFYTDYSRLESLRQPKSKAAKHLGFHSWTGLWETPEPKFETAFQNPRTEHDRITTRKLENLLRCFIGRQCTLKHDYIYALLGIASDFNLSLIHI